MSAPSPAPSPPSSPSPPPSESETESQATTLSLSRTPSPPPTEPSISIPNLLHWAIHGQRQYHNQNQTKNAQRTSPPEDPTEMSQPISVPWTISLSKSQIEILRRGFSPRMMEDKWLVYSVDGDGRGHEEEDEKEEIGEGKGRKVAKVEGEEMLRIFFVRSWTGKRVYEIEISLEPPSSTSIPTSDSASAEMSPETETGEEKGKEEDKERGEERKEAGEEMGGSIRRLIFETDTTTVTGHDDEGKVAKERVREACRWILGVELGGDGDERAVEGAVLSG